MTKFPRLHSFAIDKLALVKNILNLDDPIDAFHLPFEEFQDFNLLVSQTRANINAEEKDVWSCSWGARFSASKNLQVEF